jgi:hypothetical protein
VGSGAGDVAVLLAGFRRGSFNLVDAESRQHD